MVRISDFQIKDVVSISDGRRLGNITDIDINLDNGKIESIVVGGNGKLLSFFNKEEELVIPWNNIVKIGEDVILVRFKDQKFMGQQQLQEPKN
ncbi:YlmC/YmxH family sporulation protein [Heyndrickxia camelliae]|uniref:YlmC/YmxH family sporulation protein n=1 Tax=Heyndrickxia camelliae TaxID=1707093 RepID=A0A2N3LQX1_9BACI|nr:YlmC/YmxH family sporulation protein [Heyndrickxia camelliae]PKR86979.1 YlmC/YmxH family sporulation protein [Heyndrickxia camelliae]